MRSIYSLCIFLSLLLASCGKTDGVVPTFIHIPALDFTTTAGQGTADHDISEVWVSANGKTLGAYDLPADVPIIGVGNTEVTFFAGIKNNGKSDSKIVYPFIEPVKEIFNMSPGSRDTIIPDFRYRTNVDFINDTFDNGSSLLNDFSQSDTVFSFVDGAGVINLTEINNLFRAQMTDAVDLPEGEAVFLELNYKTNNSLAIGVQGTVNGNTQDSFAIVAFGGSAPEWKKLYVELSFAMQQISGADTYKLYVQSLLDNSNTSGEILLDNFKIVYFD